MVDRKFAVPAGLFKRVNETRAAGGTRVFDRPMHVLERIDEVRVEERRGGKGHAVAILKTVLHVFSAPEKWSGGKRGELVPMPQPRIGEQYTEYFPLVQDWAWPQLKTAIGVFFGVDPESITEEHLDIATSDKRPCAGIVVESRKIERESQKTSVVYTRCGYVRPWTATEINEVIGGNEASLTVYGGAEKLTADIEAEAAAAKA